jgi:cytoskeletal protein CcmA (bactofilin family)
MFNRGRNGEGEDGREAAASPLFTGGAGGPRPVASSATRSPGAEVPRQVPPAMQRAEVPPEPVAPPQAIAAQPKKLIVGKGISLNGKISSCDRLIVEGDVEVELQDCQVIEIAETGTFKGAAEIEGAEVSGRYEGSLTVRDNLCVHSTGQVSGTIRYGRLQVEHGGEVNGDVKSIGAKPDARQDRPLREAAK